MSGEAVRGDFPDGITGAKQYGRGVFSLVTNLYSVGFMSVDRISKLLNSLQIPISTGTVQNITARTASLSREPAAWIKQKVTDGEVVTFDETEFRVAGALSWLHCARKGVVVQLLRAEEALHRGHGRHGDSAGIQGDRGS